MTRHVFVDVEARGASPVNGQMTEFGAVDLVTRQTFHGVLIDAIPDPKNPAIPYFDEDSKRYDAAQVMFDFGIWLTDLGDGNERVVFWSDNPAYDFMWIAGEFDRWGLYNPFGHSGRRIADLAAGLKGSWKDTQYWKKWRITEHDHNPVNDSQGNVEAFVTLLETYNQKVPE